MTFKEKKNAIEEYCASRLKVWADCHGCPLYETVKEEHSNCYSEGANIARNYAMVFDQEENQNPYWERICKLSDKQRMKGMETYGQGLESNPMSIVERLTYLEEELVDSLMYIEHIKEFFNETK